MWWDGREERRWLFRVQKRRTISKCRLTQAFFWRHFPFLVKWKLLYKGGRRRRRRERVRYRIYEKRANELRFKQTVQFGQLRIVAFLWGGDVRIHLYCRPQFFPPTLYLKLKLNVWRVKRVFIIELRQFKEAGYIQKMTFSGRLALRRTEYTVCLPKRCFGEISNILRQCNSHNHLFIVSIASLNKKEIIHVPYTKDATVQFTLTILGRMYSGKIFVSLTITRRQGGWGGWIHCILTV